VAVCAGLQMCGRAISDPGGTEGPPGTVEGLGWLPVVTEFAAGKVLDRPAGRVIAGPGRGERVAGYRIHHGRVRIERAGGDPAAVWMEADDGSPLGIVDDGAVSAPASSSRQAPARGPVCGTTLHALFEDDGFRAALLAWAAARSGKRWHPSGVSFPAARTARLDRIADLLDAHLDLDHLATLIADGSPERTPRPEVSP
jgi:adenosylcobyric acid synthase